MKNGGAHLIVNPSGWGEIFDPPYGIDYWPGTGKWIDRKSGRDGRGIKSLLEFIENPPEEEPFFD